jgi:hypothetical protein
MEKNKYLVISITQLHEELLKTIKVNAVKEKVSVSQYVRSLLYKAIDYEQQKATSGVDDGRAERTMG